MCSEVVLTKSQKRIIAIHFELIGASAIKTQGLLPDHISIYVIRKYADSKGLRYDAKGNVEWTDDEDGFLIKHYPVMGGHKMHRLGILNRTPAAIMHKAKMMGLKKIVIKKEPKPEKKHKAMMYRKPLPIDNAYASFCGVQY